MRRITAAFFTSLDGVVESPDKWHFPYFNDEMGAAIGSSMSQADALLMGRVNYQEWASYWPNQTGDETPFADYMNDTPKFVVLNDPGYGRVAQLDAHQGRLPG
jgi:dihydrofolate reductase